MLRTSLTIFLVMLVQTALAESPYSVNIDPSMMQNITDYNRRVYDSMDWNKASNNPGLERLKRQTGIADDRLQEARTSQMKLLGIDDEEGQLYIFVSLSMADVMLKAYAKEASFSGAILVFRGTPPGVDMADFAKNTLAPLAKEGVTAQIDPRLYDAYGITAVPSIVFSTVGSKDVCVGRERRNYTMHDKKSVSFESCTEITPDSYWKISGGVTLLWALESFKERAAPVESRIAALKSWTPYQKKEPTGELSKADYARVLSEQSFEILKQQYDNGDLEKPLFIPIQEAQGQNE